MKISCNVIRDLLPLYLDQICSEESKDMIENHLTECEDCREYYDKMSTDIPHINTTLSESSQSLEDADLLKKIGRRITFRQIMAGGIGLAVALTLYCIPQSLTSSTSPYSSFWEEVKETITEAVPILDRRIAIDKITAGEVYQLDDGSIYCSFSVHDSFSSWNEYYVTGSSQKPQSTLYQPDSNFNAMSLKQSIDDIFRSDEDVVTYYMIVPPKLREAPENTLENSSDTLSTLQDTTGVYYVGKGGELLTFWKKGQPLENAPEEIETQVAQDRAQMEEDAVEYGMIEEGSNYEQINNYWQLLSIEEEP